MYTHTGHTHTIANPANMHMPIVIVDWEVSVNVSELLCNLSMYVSSIAFACVVVVMKSVRLGITAVVVFRITTVVVLGITVETTKSFVSTTITPGVVSNIFRLEILSVNIVDPVMESGIATFVSIPIDVVDISRRKNCSMTDPMVTLELVTEKASATKVTYISRMTSLNCSVVISSVSVNENTTMVEAFVVMLSCGML